MHPVKLLLMCVSPTRALMKELVYQMETALTALARQVRIFNICNQLFIWYFNLGWSYSILNHQTISYLFLFETSSNNLKCMNDNSLKFHSELNWYHSLTPCFTCFTFFVWLQGVQFHTENFKAIYQRMLEKLFAQKN